MKFEKSIRLCLLAIFISGVNMVDVGEVRSEGFGKALTSGWVQGHHTRVRMIAGGVVGDGAQKKLRAGIHVLMDPGWKTYWRTPGGDGGVPPYFDWSRSENLKSVEVLFPAPSRIVSDDGVSIGYKREVVFPLNIEAIDPSKPVQPILQLDYGVCKDICAPVQAALKLPAIKPSIGRGSFGRIDAQLIERFLLLVPSAPEKAKEGHPIVKNVRVNLKGARPEMIVEAGFPSGTGGADLFVEAPDGLYVALPSRKVVGVKGGMLFTIDLTKGEDPAYLRGKSLRLTLVSDTGQMETSYRVPLE